MRVKSWCWQIAKLAQCGDLGNQPVSLQLSARTCYWRFGAVVRWGGVGSGPNKGGEIDLIVLCVDFLLGPWMAQPVRILGFIMTCF